MCFGDKIAYCVEYIEMSTDGYICDNGKKAYCEGGIYKNDKGVCF
jgi:hypothetical protein